MMSYIDGGGGWLVYGDHGVLISPRQSSALHQGLGATNTLEMDCSGSHLTFYRKWARKPLVLSQGMNGALRTLPSLSLLAYASRRRQGSGAVPCAARLS